MINAPKCNREEKREKSGNIPVMKTIPFIVKFMGRV